MEEATRMGAYSVTREQGADPLTAQMNYDMISGNFGEVPGNANLASLYRAGGFTNAGIQSTYELYRRLFHFDPDVRKVMWAQRAFAIATMTAIVWALNTLLTPDEIEVRWGPCRASRSMRWMSLRVVG
jgi:hypothetical protein